MKIDTKIIKKVLYKIDPTAKMDEEFVENINMILLLMEQEQSNKDKLTRNTTPINCHQHDTTSRIKYKVKHG
tara:strand:+ start:123 stop:338 length:216 start_codon:yes stop_codon:yes gene_type:complete